MKCLEPRCVLAGGNLLQNLLPKPSSRDAAVYSLSAFTLWHFSGSAAPVVSAGDAEYSGGVTVRSTPDIGVIF